MKSFEDFIQGCNLKDLVIIEFKDLENFVKTFIVWFYIYCWFYFYPNEVINLNTNYINDLSFMLSKMQC